MLSREGEERLDEWTIDLEGGLTVAKLVLESAFEGAAQGDQVRAKFPAGTTRSARLPHCEISTPVRGFSIAWDHDFSVFTVGRKPVRLPARRAKPQQSVEDAEGEDGQASSHRDEGKRSRQGRAAGGAQEL